VSQFRNSANDRGKPYKYQLENEMTLPGESMEPLKGYQKKFLKGLAHGFKPVVYIGHKGLSRGLIGSINDALDTHELIKVKFVEFKEKRHKDAMTETIQAETGCRLVGIIGHIATFYRQQADPEKRKIQLPLRQTKKQ
jgi:RNA-binding protein